MALYTLLITAKRYFLFGIYYRKTESADGSIYFSALKWHKKYYGVMVEENFMKCLFKEESIV